MTPSNASINLNGTGSIDNYKDIINQARLKNPDFQNEIAKTLKTSHVNGSKSAMFEALDAAFTSAIFSVGEKDISQDFVSDDYNFVNERVKEIKDEFDDNVSSTPLMYEETDFLVPRVRKEAALLKERADEKMQALMPSVAASNRKDDPGWSSFDNAVLPKK